MRIWYASIFLSLLAGKLSQIEQSAGVTQFMEIFQTQKKSDHIEKQTLNQRMCKRHKVRLSFFFDVERYLIKSGLNVTLCLVHLDIVHSTGNLSQRWYCAGFKFAISVGSRKCFIQSNSVQSLGSSKFLGFFSQSLVFNTVWEDK